MGSPTPQPTEDPVLFEFRATVPANGYTFNGPLEVGNQADFLCKGIIVHRHTGPFKLRLVDHQGYYLTPDFMDADLIGEGFPLFPPLPVPKGERLLIDLQDTSGRKNVVVLRFFGSRVYGSL